MQKRIPKQERSRIRKNKILSAAYDLFSEHGYYNITTNMIAKTADVPISSLYSYFNDKDEILFELLEQYNASFLSKFDFNQINNISFETKESIIDFIQNIYNILIEAHMESKSFHQELHSLYYHIPKVAELIDSHEEKLTSICTAILSSASHLFTVSDLLSASNICVNIISHVVDCIVFHKNNIDSAKLIQESTNAIIKYLTC